MTAFDLDQVKPGHAEMFVTQGGGKTPEFGFIRIDNHIGESLIEAVALTRQKMMEIPSDPELYDPSNDYPPASSLYFPLDHPIAEKARYIHDVAAPDEITNPEEVLPSIKLYVARLYDNAGEKLTAVRNVSTPGKMLRKGRMAQWFNQELHLVTEPMFQLLDDFDFLIYGQNIFIHRHVGFEIACNLHAAIKEAAQLTAEQLKAQLDYIDFDPIVEASSKSLRLSRELAGIRANNFHSGLSRSRVLDQCNQFGIRFCEEDGRVVVDPDTYLEFLRLISRKLLGIHLREDGPEYFNVSNRTPRSTVSRS